ncbi:hypothetical protein [Amphritea balenae]|uniref:Uncharacterized protein n=1 Tax=Amphritea balenae TaxID=452629 RepID=A0A3P1SR29_9GAMM|nr:hypothetical protein [Amphritea balenae]RRC99364.1 hypothetical protein EHS89_11005 [Amphritea balenae]GGK71741.1 hypothetical protein GCM10007941_22170 [Amphritea balenae]
MNKSTLFELTLFDPENSLIKLLEQRDIEYRTLPVTRKFVVATDVTVEVLSVDNTDAQIEEMIENLALIFIEWLKGKPNRKLQVQSVDGSILYVDEGDRDAVANIVKNALKISAFDPEYNTRILNK